MNTITTIEHSVNSLGVTVLSFPDNKPEIQLISGEQPRITDSVFEIILKGKDLYNRGGKLSYLDSGKAVETSEEFIADYLGRRINFFKMKPVGEGFKRVSIDTPAWLCKRVIKLSRKAIPELIDTITAPTLRPDGSILNKPGYDPDTKLFLLPGAYPEVPEYPTMDNVREAWKTLWFPFSQFPYVSDNDRGTAAAAALTAPVRKILPKAPGFNFDAAMASSGKTLLAMIPQEMMGCGFVTPYVNDVEFRKTITAVLRDGYPALMLDNIRGHVDSPVMEAFLTSETWCDRVLQSSMMFDGPSRILFLFSGNNFQPGGDLWRRVLNCRIDPKSDNPHKRTFDFSPPVHTRQNRQKIVAAALTILRGFLCHEAPRQTEDSLGSFEEWDNLVRQCVMWLGAEKVASVADPVATIERAQKNDPARQRLSVFLKAVHKATEGEPFTSKELIEKGQGVHHSAITNILLEVATHKSSNCFGTKVLGHWMGGRVNVHCDGYWLERDVYDVDGTQEWVVKKGPGKEIQE